MSSDTIGPKSIKYRKPLPTAETILDGIAKGLSDGQIGAPYGRGRRNIEKLRKRLGIDRGVRWTEVPPEDIERVRGLVAEGKTDAAIARLMGGRLGTPYRVFALRHRQGIGCLPQQKTPTISKSGSALNETYWNHSNLARLDDAFAEAMAARKTMGARDRDPGDKGRLTVQRPDPAAGMGASSIA